MNPYLALFLGIGCAALGGELFVRGTVRLAQWVRIPPIVAGLVLAAFATSGPELSIAINAAMAGSPQISAGDALGSNVVNIALILGVALLAAKTGLRASRGEMLREHWAAPLAPVLTGLLLLDGHLSRLDGALLMACFLAWLGLLLRTVLVGRHARATDPAPHGWLSIPLCVLGMATLLASGQLVVSGAEGIARDFGVDDFIIGATVVALGTSVPELATALIAAKRGHDEVGVGTVLGSNLFNGLFILPLVALIHPFPMGLSAAALSLSTGFLLVLVILPTKNDLLPRRRGFFLIALYAAYVALTLALSP